MMASESLQVTTGIMLVQKDSIGICEPRDKNKRKKSPNQRMGFENVKELLFLQLLTNLPELSHFNVLKLLQDKTYEHLKQKISSWVSYISQGKDELMQKHIFQPDPSPAGSSWL